MEPTRKEAAELRNVYDIQVPALRGKGGRQLRGRKALAGRAMAAGGGRRRVGEKTAESAESSRL